MATGRKTGGRVPGTLNKVTKDVRAAAAVHGPAAIKRLAWLMTHAENQQTQAFAAEKILDRAYGRPTQIVAGDQERPVQFILVNRPTKKG